MSCAVVVGPPTASSEEHWCIVGVHRDPRVCSHGKGAITTDRWALRCCAVLRCCGAVIVTWVVAVIVRLGLSFLHMWLLSDPRWNPCRELDCIRWSPTSFAFSASAKKVWVSTWTNCSSRTERHINCKFTLSRSLFKSVRQKQAGHISGSPEAWTKPDTGRHWEATAWIDTSGSFTEKTRLRLLLRNLVLRDYRAHALFTETRLISYILLLVSGLLVEWTTLREFVQHRSCTSFLSTQWMSCKLHKTLFFYHWWQRNICVAAAHNRHAPVRWGNVNGTMRWQPNTCTTEMHTEEEHWNTHTHKRKLTSEDWQRSTRNSNGNGLSLNGNGIASKCLLNLYVSAVPFQKSSHSFRCSPPSDVRCFPLFVLHCNFSLTPSIKLISCFVTFSPDVDDFFFVRFLSAFFSIQGVASARTTTVWDGS